MTAFVFRRIFSTIITLFMVATVIFFLIKLAPGGPFDTDRAVPPEVEKALNSYFLFDRPVHEQYFHWLKKVVTEFDFGPSYKYPNRTVNEIIAISLPESMKLGFFAMIVALFIGIPLGIVGAIKQNTWADTAAMAAAMLGVSIPRFVLAPLLILVLALELYWFPVARWETWRHMVLPVFCAGLPTAAYIARLTRGGMLEVIRSDFVRTARAKGLSEWKVIVKHSLKGGLLPVVSYLGPGFSALLVGSLVVEKIFNIPGMGPYLVEASLNRDYNLVLGVALVYGAFLMSFNMLVDIAYAFLDPRVELK